MKYKKIMVLTIILTCLIAISAVSAAENATDDIISDDASGDVVGVEETTNQVVSTSMDLDVLSANPGNYSGLASEIGSGGNIELQHDYYTYDSGSTIEITVDNTVIDGKGAVIDMAGSTIRAFMVTAPGATFKNLTIKNTSCNGNGRAIQFSSSGTVINCNFIGSKPMDYSDGGGALYFNGMGSVINCNFTNNNAYLGSAVHFCGNGNVINCNFTNNTAPGGHGAVYFRGNGNVTDCNFTNNTASGNGGAVYFHVNGNVTNCNFTGNKVSDYCDGGAVYFNGMGSVINCNFTGNTASDSGGAIRFNGNGTVLNSNFTNNSVTGNSFGEYGWGSAVFFGVDSSGSVVNCNFTNNAARHGGAVYFRGNGNVTDCNFTNNTASIDGGAVCFYGNGNVTDCNFTNNAARRGGAIYWEGSNGSVFNCNFVNCSADSGGAIYWAGDNGVVSMCSFLDCVASADGGSIYWEGNNGKLERLSLAYSDASNAAVYVTSNSVLISNSKIKCGINNINAAIQGGIISNCTIFEIIAPVVNISVNNIQFGKDELVNVTLPTDATGDLKLTLIKDDEILDNRSSAVSSGFASHEFSSLDMGVYKVNVHYSGDSNYKEVSRMVGFTVGPVVVISQGRTVGDDVSVFMDFGCKNNGSVLVRVNSKMVALLGIEDGILNSSFSTSRLTAGNLHVTFEYESDMENDPFNKSLFTYWDAESNKYLPVEYDLHLLHKEVTIEKTFESNDEGIIVLTLPENATGTVEVFVDGVREMVVEIINGVAKIDLSKYKGKYSIVFKYSGDDVYAPFNKSVLVDVYVKVARIAASDLKVIYTSKSKYSVKVYDSEGKLASGVKVTFLINNKAVKTVTTGSNGVASIAISKVPGSYKITAKAAKVRVTKKLTVTHLLTLKSVKVKKSAKKLVLTATLKKVNGKYLKKKTVTFKFNGKKYKAKTNKKGVAKYTIKSNVLKKLKVGKKVKYQATYLKDTVKKTVKVKK